jgi:ferredoxin
MIASVDPETCIGCTLCTRTCPLVFRMEDDKSVVHADPVPPEAYECAKKAAKECPVGAITVSP